MNFFEELSWRGMLHDHTPEVDEILKKPGVVGYIGFDPTAPSMTIGNYVQIMILKLFQLSGHKPIVLMGGATGRIGDPSGKDKERELKTIDELDVNLSRQKQQVSKFLDFDGPNAAEVVNNYDFYKDMNVLDFLRNVGKSLTVNYMMAKESVKKRVETGISFTEFSYQLLQGYDFVCLYQQKNCLLQMGGSDQWGNITSGTELIRRHLGEKAYAVTSPLLTKADGKKFGKSEEGNIWLDPNMTSPYKFYQFWINADDRDIPTFTRYFTLKSREEVEAMEQEYAEDPRMLKALLAEELTRRIHSDEAYETVQQVTSMLFGKKASKEELLGLKEDALKTIAEEIPSFTVPLSILQNGVNIVDLLSDHTAILESKSEVRRAIKGNAIAVNKDKVKSHEDQINTEALILGKYCMIENGKRNKFMIVAE
jgi:tyrosyl-tRNA synthetase